MKLTLRTLIAWLDDTLTPAEVRTIGHLVSETPYAKELVDRVQRVTRQRRLTYPGDLGSEATDPNRVAEYLEDQLPAEQVAEFEKLCLTSDVHLAEVASVHQVLSLIGQKAKVPADAKARMYRLVRGRETTKPPISAESPAKPKPAPSTPKRPVTEPIAAWSASVKTRKSVLERFGPAVAVLGLIGVMTWAAVYSLTAEQQPTNNDLAVNGLAKPVVKPPTLPLPAVDTPPVVVAPPVNPAPVPPETLTKVDPPKPPEVSTPDDIGTFEAIQGVILRANPDGSGWDRIEAKAPLKERSRLLNLSPFRNTIRLGKAEVDLVDSTAIYLDDLEKEQQPRLELKHGQIVVKTAAANTPFEVRFDGQVLAIVASPGLGVGVERIASLSPGQAEPTPAKLRIFIPDGKVILRSSTAEETVNGPGEISLQLSGRFGEKARQPLPTWVTETAPSGFSKEVGNQFVALLRPGRPILSDLVEAMDDPQKDVKRMALHALGSIGSMEQVVEVVSRKEEATVHRAGIDVLRSGLAQGGDTAKSVRDALVSHYDQHWATITEKLLVGFRPEEAKEDVTMIKLVEYLTAPSRGTRQLALDNLRSITGRDNLEYDPDVPEGKGLKAWQDLIRKKESGKESRSNAGNPR